MAAVALLLLGSGGATGDDPWAAFPAESAMGWTCTVYADGVASMAYEQAFVHSANSELLKQEFSRWEEPKPDLGAVKDCEAWLKEANRRVSVAKLQTGRGERARWSKP